jgi:hypothetical protein
MILATPTFGADWAEGLFFFLAPVICLVLLLVFLWLWVLSVDQERPSLTPDAWDDGKFNPSAPPGNGEQVRREHGYSPPSQT